MGSKCDTIINYKNLCYYPSIPSAPKDSVKNETFFETSMPPQIGDSIKINKKNATKTDSNETSSTKKWLIAAGIGVAAIGLGVACAYLWKTKTPKIAGDTIKKLKDFSNFDVFKELKMCKNLNEAEKLEVFKILSKGDKNVFLSTLYNKKPMALLGQYKLPTDTGDCTLGLLKKLDLGKNFEFIDGIHFSSNGHRAWNQYFVNKSELLKTITKNKDIYIARLGLNKNSSSKEIYEALFDLVRKSNGQMYDDLLGISLGFPKNDSIIYNIEQVAKLARERCTADYIPKLLEAFKTNSSLYKDLSPSRLKEIEQAIKNINQKNLEQIGLKGSYNDGVYQFINFCDDAQELKRIKTSVDGYKATFDIV